MALTGSIDLVGYHRPGGGWLLAGWLAVAPGLARGLKLETVLGRVDGARPAGRTLVALFERGGLEQPGTGVLLFIEGTGARPLSVQLEFGRQSCVLSVVPGARGLGGGALVEQGRLLLDTAFAGQREALGALLAMADFAGQTALDGLEEAVQAGVDELIPCGPDGAVLIGWMLARRWAIRAMTLCCGTERWPVAEAHLVLVERPDVRDALGAEVVEDPRCGFVAFVPGAGRAGADAFLALAGRCGGVGYVAMPPRRLRGVPAIRRMLEMLDLRGVDCRPGLERVVGPAMRLLQAARRAEAGGFVTATFGTPAVAPRHSLVIPLHGRIDHLEYQMALFSAEAAGWDLVWVLDDPPRRQAALDLAESVLARFGVPFRLLLMADNVGFAAASNAGLSVARGEYVGFLNSDVFPAAPGFMDGLAATLEADAGLGAVGGLLLFEDGSVQHEGMAMEAMPGLGGLRFPLHVRKGRRPGAGGVTRWPAITGACLVMRRSLAVELGGFDEDYVIGDFEDCDLCDRIAARGLGVAVDPGVRLYHLERQSQAGPEAAWRRNLTTYNAWLYEAKRGAG